MVAGVAPRPRPKRRCSPSPRRLRYLDPSRTPPLVAGDGRCAGGRDGRAARPHCTDDDDWRGASARTVTEPGTPPSSRPAPDNTNGKPKTADRTPTPGTGATPTPQPRHSPSRPGGGTGQPKPISGSVRGSTNVGAPDRASAPPRSFPDDRGLLPPPLQQRSLRSVHGPAYGGDDDDDLETVGWSPEISVFR